MLPLSSLSSLHNAFVEVLDFCHLTNQYLVLMFKQLVGQLTRLVLFDVLKECSMAIHDYIFLDDNQRKDSKS